MGSSIAASEVIRKNAQLVLEKIGLIPLANKYGELFFTGSYALNLMTWNDIDMQIVFQQGRDPKEAFLEIFGHFVKTPEFIKAEVIHFTGDYKSFMPRGFYLGMHMNFSELGGIWKLDLWALSEKDFQKNRSLLEALEEKITPESRALILAIKRDLMKKEGRVPQMGSHFLYQAVLLEGIKDRDLINEYLRKNGVSL